MHGMEDVKKGANKHLASINSLGHTPLKYLSCVLFQV